MYYVSVGVVVKMFNVNFSVCNYVYVLFDVSVCMCVCNNMIIVLILIWKLQQNYNKSFTLISNKTSTEKFQIIELFQMTRKASTKFVEFP